MLDLKQLNQAVGVHQLAQLKKNAEYEKRISNLLQRVHTLEEVRKVQIDINRQLLKEDVPEKLSLWERIKVKFK